MSEPAISLPFSPAPAERPPAARAPAARSFVGHAKLIGLLTLASRILGMAREIVMAHYLGVGLVASAFSAAFTVPNLFRKLFGEGALSAAFIPLYAQAVKKEVGGGEWGVGGNEAQDAPHGERPRPTPHSPPPTSASPTSSASEFAAASVNLLLAILVGVTLLGELVIGAILLLAPALRPDWLLTLKYAAIMLPYVILICGTAFLGGILQVHRRFGPAAAAPIILNVCHVAVVFTGAWMLGMNPWQRTPLGVREQTILGYWLSFFVLVAGVLQLLILAPGLRAVGFRLRPVLHFWTPAVRQMLRLTLPVAIGAGVLQISVLLDKGISLVLTQYPGADGQPVTHFAFLGHLVRYPMESGALARLSVAQFLYQFPLGVFAIALATAIFPGLSEGAFDADRESFRATLRQGIEATLFEGLPASLGLILVREPAVRLLFQHGLIHAHDAELIARSVLFYSMAIWAFSLQQILSRAYYAMHDTRTPLVMSVVTLSINLVVEIPLLWTRLGEAGMAAGTFASFGVQALVMLWMLDRRVGGLGLSKLAKPVAKMLLATAAMGAALWLLKHSPLYPTGERRSVWLTQLLLMTGTGAGVYFAACEAMGIGIIEHLRPKRLSGRTGPAVE